MQSDRPAARPAKAALAALLLGALTCSSCSLRKPPPQPRATAPGWFGCGSDSECELIQDATCSYVPVNRGHAREVLSWVKRYQPRPASRPPCTHATGGLFGYRAVCVAGLCSSSRER